MRTALQQPPLLVVLTRINIVQQAAAIMFAQALEEIVSPNCSAYHVDTQHGCTAADMRLAEKPLPLDPSMLLHRTHKCYRGSKHVETTARNIAAELGTQLYTVTTEDMLHASRSNTRSVLPRGLQQFLGLPDVVWDDEGRTEAEANWHSTTYGPKLQGTIANFDEVSRYFEKHAPARLNSMLRSPS